MWENIKVFSYFNAFKRQPYEEKQNNIFHKYVEFIYTN